MTRFLSITPYYYSNFAPHTLPTTLKNFNQIVIKSSSKIVSKNFIMFLLFLKFWAKKNRSRKQLLFKIRLFTKPSKQNIFNFLRAPYKNKLARNQLYTPVYKYSVQLHLYSTQTYQVSQPEACWLLLDFLIKNFLFFESNVAYLNKLRFNLIVLSNSYWNYNPALINYNER